MDSLLDWQHDYRLNVILLSAIGLWPFDNKLVLLLKRFIGSSFALCCCFGQLATFSTVHYTKRLLLRNVPCIFVGCGVLLKYISFLATGTYIKRITETINSDCNNASSKEEIDIIEKYIERGKFHTKGFAMFICPVGISLLIAPLSSALFDTVSLNESRSRGFPIMFEVFMDQKKHFFYIAFLYDGCIIVGALIFVSTETLFIVYVQHACALFEVTRHCKTLKERFSMSYLILLTFGILSLGAHLLHCAQSLTSYEYTESITSGLFCLAILGYMFYLNFVSQRLLDLSANTIGDLYKVEWYKFPISTRKLVLFCMLNSTKPTIVDVYGIFVPSYEGFSLIVRMTMSYATTLYSFQ